MIYTFGCSMTKYYWPMWPEWLQVYQSQPVTNLGYKGYGNSNIYWDLLSRIDKFTPTDHIMIMWANNHRLAQWYDREWIDRNDCLGFFPDTNGHLWFTEDEPYLGLYRTHPEKMTSFTNMIFETFNTIYQTQLLLQMHGLSYSMMFSQNPWVDARPEYHGTNYRASHDKHGLITKKEIKRALKILELDPLKKIIEKINWDNIKPVINDPFDPAQLIGIWEYHIRSKERILLMHEYDLHPPPLTFHDYTLEVIMEKDVSIGKHRKLAREMSETLIDADIPQKFTDDEYVAPSENSLLMEEYKWMQQK